jgi:SAM-dependent methyltransferase
MIPDISSQVRPAEQNFRELVDCPFCKSVRYSVVTRPDISDYGHSLEPIFKNMQFQMAQCADCGTVYQRNRPKPQHLGQFYETGDYHCYESLLNRGMIIRTAAIASAKNVVKDIDRLRPHRTDTVVDFGCGSGSWIELFKLVGAPWNVIGTEIFPALCEAVERSGAKCLVADHDTIDKVLPHGSVDCLFMHHVIEHVPSPLEFFKKARTVLTDDGIIYGQTPNWRCWEHSIFGTNWVQWHLPHHLVVFDFDTMAAHAEAAGYRLLKVSSSVSGATQHRKPLASV